MSETSPPQEHDLQTGRVELDHSEDVVQLINLVCVHLSQHAYAQAEPLLVRLLAHLTAQGHEGSQVATVLASLATVRQALGTHELAEQLWRRALAIRERALAPNHFAIARNLEHLADACAAQGKLEEALDLLRRALDIDERGLPVTNASVAAVRAKLAELVLLASQEALLSRPAPRSAAPAPTPDEAGGATRPLPAASRSPPLATATSDPVVFLSERGPSASEHRPSAGEDDAPPRPRVAWRTRWHRLLPRTTLGALAALAARAQREDWLWPAAFAGVMIAVVVLVPVFTPRGGVRRSLPPPRAAAQSAGSNTDRATAVIVEAAAVPRAAPRPPSIGVETGAVPAAGAKTTDTDRAEHAATPIPTMNRRLAAEDLAAAKRAAARQLAEDGGRIAEVVPDTASSAGTGAGAVGRLLVGEPAGPVAAALSDSSRPAALAPGSPMPAYPPALWSEGTSGKVLVELLVDSSGRADLASVDVLYSDNAQFTRAVRTALPQMQFIPAMADGRRRAQLLRLPFIFAPGGNPR